MHHLEVLALHIHLSSLPKDLQKAMGRDDALMRGLFQRPESLSALLPHADYLADDRIFIMKDGSLGAIFAIELLEHEAMNAAAVVSAVHSLKSWLSLPENCSLQIVYDQQMLSPHDQALTTLASR